MNWTQPVCDKCFAEKNPGREPVKLKEPDPEICCLCGALNKSGIYIRIDPTTVKYPSDV